MIKKRRVLGFASLLLLVIFICGSVIAFFISRDTVTNNFKSGDIQTEIEENFNPKTGEKEVWIKNPIDIDSLVRVSITLRMVDPNNTNNIIPVDLDKVELVFSEDCNNNWYKGDDGYYYYKTVLKGSEKTENLLKEVKILESYKEKNLGMEVTVDVKAEAVQPTRYEIENGLGSKEVRYVFNENWIEVTKDKELQDILKNEVDLRYY